MLPFRRPTAARSRPLRASPIPSAAVLVLALAGCGGDGGQERVPMDGGAGLQGEVEALPTQLQAQLDSGNAAYRAREHGEALRHFREVARLAPDLAAGWYGIGMTEAARGNSEAADSAMMRVHELAPAIPLQHPGTSGPANPHPPGPPGAEGDGSPDG